MKPLLAIVGVSMGLIFAVPGHADPGIEEPPSNDNNGSFLTDLNKVGIGFSDPNQAVSAGQAVCGCIHNGMSGLHLIKHLQETVYTEESVHSEVDHIEPLIIHQENFIHTAGGKVRDGCRQGLLGVICRQYGDNFVFAFRVRNNGRQHPFHMERLVNGSEGWFGEQSSRHFGFLSVRWCASDKYRIPRTECLFLNGKKGES